VVPIAARWGPPQCQEGWEEMTEPIDLPGLAEAARMLDEQTQQLTPVQALLDDEDTPPPAD